MAGVAALLFLMPLGGALLGDLGFAGWWYVLGWLAIATVLFSLVTVGVMVLIGRKEHRPPPPWVPPSQRDPRL